MQDFGIKRHKRVPFFPMRASYANKIRISVNTFWRNKKWITGLKGQGPESLYET